MRVLLVDAQHLLREGLRTLLESESTVEVVGAVSHGKTAVTEAQRSRPDIALLDVVLPDVTGFTVIEELQATTQTRCLILSASHSSSLVNQSLRAGAFGYLLKSASPGQLLEALRAVAAGQYYFSPEVVRHVVDAAIRPQIAADSGLTALTAREREIVKMIGEGLSTKEIASALGISHRTADGHRAHIMSKLSIHRSSGLVRFAIREGLVEV